MYETTFVIASTENMRVCRLCRSLVLGVNSLTTGSIYMYICAMNRLRIAVCSALHIYVKGTSPTLLESAFDTLSPSASGLGIGHTRTKIWPFKRGSQLVAIDFTLFAGVLLPEASFGKPIVARLVD